MKHLLEMIEAVDPKDTAKLDEIDARVAVFVFNGTLEKTSFGTWAVRCYGNRFTAEEYTRSRNSLKAIRPQGWLIDIFKRPAYSVCILLKIDDVKGDTEIKSPLSDTEELAELHAIIQALEHERKSNEEN